MPDSIRLKQATSLKHQANLGEEVAEVEIPPDEELTVLAEWESAYLVKNSDGKLFNVKKDLVAGAGG
jgi:hypothetical protein